MSESVLLAPEPPTAEGRRRRWPFMLIVVVVALLVLAGTVRVPYFAIAPGGAVPVGELVEVTDGPSFPPTEGGMYLTTVSLGRVTALEALRGWLDPAVDVVKEEAILPPGVDDDELRSANLELMESSKRHALAVAFEQLGFDAVRGEGAVVTEVVDGSPADGVLAKGDVIVAVDDQPIELNGEAVRLIGERRPGDRVRLQVTAADTTSRQVEVVLGEAPDGSDRAFLGVALRTSDPRFDFPYEVDVQSERIGGPSAGLAFTLQVLDELTEGDLTGGRRVAATGTIELDGSVGDVGGVVQKTAAVRRAGIDLFLVPADEADEARAHAGEGLRIEPVETISDALRILASLGGDGLALDRPGRSRA